MFDAWIVMIVAPMFRQFQIRSLGRSVAANLIFETVLTFKVGLEAFCMTFLDSSLSLFNKTWNLTDVKLLTPSFF
jgi:hypothetical protein